MVNLHIIHINFFNLLELIHINFNNYLGNYHINHFNNFIRNFHTCHSQAHIVITIDTSSLIILKNQELISFMEYFN